MSVKADTGRSWVQDHLAAYLESGGHDGHIMDFTALGGRADQKTLLLRTVGRRSGTTKLAPLIYEKVGDEYAIIASKGGAPEHPGWYHNLAAAPEVRFQVGPEIFRGTCREADGAERERVWARMVEAYAPYADYQAKTSRRIPVILLKPLATVAAL